MGIRGRGAMIMDKTADVSRHEASGGTPRPAASGLAQTRPCPARAATLG
jgi:hypothetical protein